MGLGFWVLACARGGLVGSEVVARGENVIAAVPRAALLQLLTLLARAQDQIGLLW